MGAVRTVFFIACLIAVGPQGRSYAQTAEPLDVINGATDAIAKSLDEIHARLQDPAVGWELARHAETEELLGTLRQLTGLRTEQTVLKESLTVLIRRYVETGDPADWTSIKSRAASNSLIVQSIGDSLDKFSGSFAYRDLEAYQALVVLIRERGGIYEALNKLEPPTTDVDKAKLLAFADRFEALAMTSQKIEQQVAKYLGELNPPFDPAGGQKMWQTIAAAAFAVVFIATILVLAFRFPRPTPFQYTVSRIVLALACAGFATLISGFIEVTIPNFVKAGGALAIFAIVYFYSPADLAVKKKKA